MLLLLRLGGLLLRRFGKLWLLMLLVLLQLLLIELFGDLGERPLAGQNQLDLHPRCGWGCCGSGCSELLLLSLESQSFVGRGMGSGKGRVEADWLAGVADPRLLLVGRQGGREGSCCWCC